MTKSNGMKGSITSNTYAVASTMRFNEVPARLNGSL